MDGDFVAFTGNPRGGKIEGQGTVCNGVNSLENVNFVLQLKYNLMSVSQICDKDLCALFNSKECLILKPGVVIPEDLILRRAPRRFNTYSMDMNNPLGIESCFLSKASEDESFRWRKRLRHVNFKTMNRLVRGNLVTGLALKDSSPMEHCLSCSKGKQHKSSQQETPSAAQGGTTSAGGPSSPTFVSNPQSALTIFTGQVAKTKDVVEVKIEETGYDLPSVSEWRDAKERGIGKESSADVVILDEEEIGSDHELNALLEEIDNYRFNEDYPEILATEDLHEENVRYFTEEGEEFQALSDDDKDEANVKVDLVHTEPTPTEPTQTTHTESTPSKPIQPPKPKPDYLDPKRPWMRKLPVEEPPKCYEWRYKGGVEHFKTSHEFRSLPRYDLRALAKLLLQKPGKVNEARNFEQFLKQQALHDFRSMNTTLLKRIISKTKIHPRTQKPWVSLRYKPAETVKSIVLPRSVPVQLQKFRKWFYNSTIESAVIECEGKEDIVIFEPMELLKFQPEDLEVLFKNPIKLFHGDDEADAKAYQRVV
ncbi:hypothetical protein L1987_13700 [Smallanthus sonchifolius]|uniref:Uncharacterized protein n=1 Tax=Smallanthus sonchifolius TaxID=185202 RepID=A0ACB9JH67_9ASTR|nr:hypothetical protein L1987_13700 [Smallanthus sonchifolius]